MDIVWTTPPEGILNELQKAEKEILEAIYAAAAAWGQGTQDQARANAPWEDRTGNARQGIFYAVDGFGLGTQIGQVSLSAHAHKGDITVESGDKDVLIITLGHTVYYGKFLETSRGGKWAIIMSTIESRLPELERELRAIVG